MSSLIFLFQVLVVLIVATLSIHCGTTKTYIAKDVYIVYMGSLPEGEYSSTSHHSSILQEVLGESAASNSIIRSYTRSFNRFAARLSKKEVVSVFPSKKLKLQTTRSWDFVGLTETMKRNPISVLLIVEFDPSQKVLAMKVMVHLLRNGRLIGARSYKLGSESSLARDEIGHGIHTASTAAGNKVPDTSFYGMAKDNAHGGVPFARIAAYKVCGEGDCLDLYILAAFDDAIADGVVVTISVGGDYASPFEIVSSKAGNSGPTPSTVSSVAPWLFSIAANSIDGKFIIKFALANGQTLIRGNAVNPFTLNGTNFPLVNGKNLTTTCPEDVTRGRKEAFKAGAIGAITTNDGRDDIASIVPLPTSALTDKDHDIVMLFGNPQGSILKSEVIEHTTAPIAASSSHGPNPIAVDILKVRHQLPTYHSLSLSDITAPGIDIIAAYSPHASPSRAPGDNRSSKYNILSGTSMSCPHVTAWPMNVTKQVDDVYGECEFAFRAGHINPVKAIELGLVYEALKEDYIKMLSSIQISYFGTCPKGVKGSPKDLNYPSMQALVESDKSFTVKFPKIVTNVGTSNSTYKVKVITDSHINVSVKPSSLSFKSLGEKQSFVVIVSRKGLPAKARVFASIVWSDDTHNVTSPIVVYTK
ncbi:subtilisin-like protease sbt4.9 [Quercus suber]|uniref:Subtilisin-like protease sbt4.9 n=1 Tax=Quercus suber TaxID=58331 RepID=A0AAW0JJ82_QUESU